MEYFQSLRSTRQAIKPFRSPHKSYNTGITFFRFARKNKAFIYFFRSNIFVEVLSYKQISDILIHLLGTYSKRELIMYYYNLLDFRFVQGSIVCPMTSLFTHSKFLSNPHRILPIPKSFYNQ